MQMDETARTQFQTGLMAPMKQWASWKLSSLHTKIEITDSEFGICQFKQ
jgi:hypothetical protein